MILMIHSPIRGVLLPRDHGALRSTASPTPENVHGLCPRGITPSPPFLVFPQTSASSRVPKTGGAQVNSRK